jgi:hypothetical protein
MNPLNFSINGLYQKIINRDKMILPKIDKKYYKPPFSLKDKIILDIGSYIGDSAYYFLELGAKKVICIEPFYADILRNNIFKYKLNAEVIEEKFKIEHLSIKCDFIKMDIEGYEELILNEKINTPIVLEIHGLQLRDKFLEKGYTLMYMISNYCCISYMNNYKMVGL